MPEPAATVQPAAPAAATRFGAAVAGLGTALPDTVVPNAAIAERIGVTDDWIVSRTGIRERRHLAADEPLSELAAQAARAALDDAGLDAADLDMILAATATQDDIIPTLAPMVGGLLGVQAGALDVGAACTGFLGGLQLAGAQLESGRADAVLVIGAEKLSAFLDPDDKRTASIFGDAAGAVVLTRTESPGEMHPVVMHAEAQRQMLFADRSRGLIEMEGQEVFKHAVARMTEATHEALEAAGTTLEDIDLFVYHQANTRIIRSVGQRLGLPADRVVDCIANYGNVSAASLPLALADARAAGRLPDGARLLLSAFGAGFVWGATVVDWRASA